MLKVIGLIAKRQPHINHRFGNYLSTVSRVDSTCKEEELVLPEAEEAEEPADIEDDAS